jgi:hypothetical protein
LVETYRRFKEYGVWDEVKSIDSGKGRGIGHATVAGKEFEVAGGTASVKFTAKDGDAFQKKLIATKHFGLDGSIMGREHKGQKSNREWSGVDNKSMHVSIGKDNKFDVHIDKNSPVKQPEHGKTQVDLKGSKKHGVEELIPSKIKNTIHRRGISVDATIDENRKGWHGGEFKIGAKFEIHGPVPKKPQLNQSSPGATVDGYEKMMENVSSRVDRAHIHFPTPIGMKPDEMPDAQAIASRMAAEMIDAAKKGNTSIQMNISEYFNKHEDQVKVMKYMEEIGKIVRSQLVAADPELNSVVGLTVTFGDKSQKGSVPLN